MIPLGDSFSGSRTVTLTLEPFGSVFYAVGSPSSDTVLIAGGLVQTPTLNLDRNDRSGAGGGNYSGRFRPGFGPVPVAEADASVTSPDALDSLTVTITNPLDGSQETLTANTSGTAIAAGYSDGVLTLSGSDTAADYQQVLESVRYSDGAASPDLTAAGSQHGRRRRDHVEQYGDRHAGDDAGQPADRQRLQRDPARERFGRDSRIPLRRAL